MKKTIAVAFFFILFNCAYSQTYYGYQERGSNSQVDWGKLGEQLSKTIQQSYDSRESRKEYYYNISVNTKDAIINGTQLTSDELTNNKIILLQEEVLRFLRGQYNLMTGGLLEPTTYEYIVKSVHSKYEEANDIFININRNKEQKIQYSSYLETKTRINNNYKEVLNSISEYRIDRYGIYCKTVKLYYGSMTEKEIPINNLYQLTSTN
jgi:hypothetical protein